MRYRKTFKCLVHACIMPGPWRTIATVKEVIGNHRGCCRRIYVSIAGVEAGWVFKLPTELSDSLQDDVVEGDHVELLSTLPDVSDLALPEGLFIGPVKLLERITAEQRQAFMDKHGLK